MRKDGRVAVGRFVMRTKEYVACVRPFGDALALQTLFFADEVRDVGEVVEVPAHAAASARELALAAQLIESLAGRWDPRAHEDTFRESVLAVVDRKAQGQTIEAGPPGEEPGRVVDLMAALKETLARRSRGAARAPRARARRAARRDVKAGRHRRARATGG
jgi:DNA end-binding protein Ku